MRSIPFNPVSDLFLIAIPLLSLRVEQALRHLHRRLGLDSSEADIPSEVTRSTAHMCPIQTRNKVCFMPPLAVWTEMG